MIRVVLPYHLRTLAHVDVDYAANSRSGLFEIAEDHYGEIWYQITLSDWFRFPDAEWLRARWICWLATNGSLLLEGSFPFLVWTRLRFPLVLLLIGFHVAIAILFSNAVLFFNLAAVAALCGFLKTSDFARLKQAQK